MKRFDLLRSPLLVLAVGLLLLNDFVLKAAFHNWLTGKLSDFAGLAAITIFCCALWPRHVRRVGTGIAIFFAFWKSPHSAGLIEAANAVLPFAIGRTVDYGDLIALPVVWLVCRNAHRLPLVDPGRIGVWLTAGLCLFAFTSTSYMDSYRPSGSFDIADPAHQSISEAQLGQLFNEIAGTYGLRCYDPCRPLSVGRSYRRPSDHVVLQVSFDAQRRRVFFGVEAVSMSEDQTAGLHKQADQLKAEIERDLGVHFPTVTISAWQKPPLSAVAVDVTLLPSADDVSRAVAVIDDFMRAQGFEVRGTLSSFKGPKVGPTEWALTASGDYSTTAPFHIELYVYAWSSEYFAAQREIAKALAERLEHEFAGYLPFDRYLVRVKE